MFIIYDLVIWSLARVVIAWKQKVVANVLTKHFYHAFQPT